MPFDGALRSPADLIDHAISMISSRDAWCQANLADDHGRHCAVGALLAATFGDGDVAHLSGCAIAVKTRQPDHQIILFRDALFYLNRSAQRRGFDHIMRLNDNQHWFFKRTPHKVVLAAMRDAARDARNAEAALVS